jgi:hypothetical protein
MLNVFDAMLYQWNRLRISVAAIRLCRAAIFAACGGNVFIQALE